MSCLNFALILWTLAAQKTMFHNHKSPFRFCACEIFKQNVLLKFMSLPHSSLVCLYSVSFCLHGLRRNEIPLREACFLLVSSFWAERLPLFLMYLSRQVHENYFLPKHNHHSSWWKLSIVRSLGYLFLRIQVAVTLYLFMNFLCFEEHIQNTIYCNYGCDRPK